MLEESNFVQSPGTTADVHVSAESVPGRRIDRSFLVDLLRLTNVLRRHVGPLFGQSDHGTGVHEPVTELVGDLPFHTVEDPAGFFFEGSRAGGQNNEILHVAPGEAGIRLESESGDSSGYGSRSGSSGVLDGANVIGTELGVHIDGRDAFVVARSTGGVRGGQGRAAFLQVPGFVATLGRA